MAIREQLAKFPNDFEGVMLLANIQAEDLNDLPVAEITLNNFCNLPEAPPNQVAAALTQLADWHLKKSQDVGSARAACWNKSSNGFPKPNLALQAAQRIAHLGGTEKILLAAHDRQAMAVPEGVNNIGLLDSTDVFAAEGDRPGQAGGGLCEASGGTSAWTRRRGKNWRSFMRGIISGWIWRRWNWRN